MRFQSDSFAARWCNATSAFSPTSASPTATSSPPTAPTPAACSVAKSPAASFISRAAKIKSQARLHLGNDSDRSALGSASTRCIRTASSPKRSKPDVIPELRGYETIRREVKVGAPQPARSLFGRTQRLLLRRSKERHGLLSTAPPPFPTPSASAPPNI